MRSSVPGTGRICAPGYRRVSRISRDSESSAGENRTMVPCVATSVRPAARARIRNRATSSRFCTGVGRGP